MFKPFLDMIAQKLLFLRNVRSIEVWEWNSGEESPECAISTKISTEGHSQQNEQEDARRQRRQFIDAIKEMMEASQMAKDAEADTYQSAPVTQQYFAAMNTLQNDRHSFLNLPRPMYQLTLYVELGEDLRGSWAKILPHKNARVHEEDWLICSAFGGEFDSEHGCLRYAAEEAQRKAQLVLMPHAAVAAMIGSRELGGDKPGDWTALKPEASDQGQAYVTLPLPVKTGFPLHCNGRWQVLPLI